MSEAADLNRDPNFERMLRELTPERLEVSRDELFFQAGFAAGGEIDRVALFGRRLRRRERLPAVVWRRIRCSNIRNYWLRLAAASDLKTPIAVAAEQSAKPQTDAVVVDRALAIERQPAIGGGYFLPHQCPPGG